MTPVRVYVVEDEALIAMELEDRLRAMGYDVCGHAVRAAEALRAIPALRPDLVILDVNLGPGPSGLDVAEALAAVSDVPIVFLTAYAEPRLTERAARSNTFAYLVKPFQPDALRASLELTLAKHAAERQLKDANRRLDETAASLRAQAGELERSRALLEAAFDATADGIVVVDLDGAITHSNRRYWEIWGVDAAHALAMAPAELRALMSTRAKDPEAWRRSIEAMLGDFERDHADVVELADGRTLERTVRPQRVGGRAVGRVISYRDVTRQRAADAALRASEERFRRVVEHMSEGLVIDDVAGRIVFCNDRYLAIVGAARDRVIGSRLEDHVAPAWREVVRGHHERRLAGGAAPTRYHYQAQRDDGAEVWVEADVVVRHDLDGAVVGTQATLRDVTARRAAEVALRDSEARFRVLFEQAAVGVAEVDTNTGQVVRANRKYAEIVGRAPAELPGLGVAQLTHPADLVDGQERLAALRRGTVRELSFEQRVIRKDGAIVWVALTLSPLWSPGEPAGRHIAVLQDVTTRKETEARLLRARDQLESTLAAVPDLLFEVDADGRLLDYRAPDPRQLVVAATEFLGRTVAEVMPADAAPVIMAALAEALETGQSHGRSYRLALADGERWFELSVARKRTMDDGVPHLIVLARDITERKRVEAALEVLSTGVARLTGDQLYAELARQMARLLDADAGFVATVYGADGAHLRTRALAIDGQLAPPLEAPIAGSPCEVAIRDGAVLVARGAAARFPASPLVARVGADGFAMVALVDSSGRVVGTAGVASRGPLPHPDRVEQILRLFAVRAAAELERRRDEARFHDLFEFAPDAIVIVNEAGAVVLANQQAEVLFGYPRAELVGLGVEALMPEATRGGHAGLRRRFLTSSLPRQMGSQGRQLIARRRDGEIVPVDIGLSPMRSDEGVLVVAAVRDVRERVRAEDARHALEAQLRHAQKMEAVGTLAGGIAHDFNNILMSVFANVELARADLGPHHHALENLDSIGRAADRAADLVRQILTFSRKHAPKRTVMPLRPLVEEAAQLLRVAIPAGIELAIVVVGEIPPVWIDASQLHQVIMNLGTNAFHAIDRPHGRVELAVAAVAVEADGAPHPALRPGRYARLTVSDDGVGIPPDTRERIFEPFFTTKAVGKGTGLGLAVAHGIVTEHGGQITVESEVGRGTSFHVWLPAAEATRPVSTAVVDVPSVPRGQGQRVFYVDDEEPLVLAAVRSLERIGYQPTGYTRGAEALDAILRDARGVDLVITDRNMPGMTGLELAAAIERVDPRLPVILVSGVIDDATAPNVRHLLTKPYSTIELARVLHRVLGKA